MMMQRFFKADMSAFAPCANANTSCAQTASAHTALILLDAILASIFVVGLIAILGLISLILLAILVLVGLVIRNAHTPWCLEPNSLPV